MHVTCDHVGACCFASQLYQEHAKQGAVAAAEHQSMTTRLLDNLYSYVLVLLLVHGYWYLLLAWDDGMPGSALVAVAGRS